MRLEEARDHCSLIRSVRVGDATAAGLRASDILVRVDEWAGLPPAMAALRIKAAWAAGKSGIQMVVLREGRCLSTTLRLRH